MFDINFFIERNFMLKDTKRDYIVKEIIFPLVEKYGTTITPEVVSTRIEDAGRTIIDYEDNDLTLTIDDDENYFELLCINKNKGVEIVSKIEKDSFYVSISREDSKTLIFNSIDNHDNLVTCKIFNVKSTKAAQVIRKKDDTIFETLTDLKNAILDDGEVLASPKEIGTITDRFFKTHKVKVRKIDNNKE